MTTELGLTTILIGVLLTIHGAYFVVVRKMGHLGSLSAMIAFI